MHRRALCMAAALSLASASVAAASWKQVPVVRHEAEVEVAAPPAAVWAYVTSGRNFVTWCPQWKSAKNAAHSIVKVGDVLDYMDEWGHGGRSIVTYLAKDKELRVAHEPDDGSYICQAKFVLTPTPRGTRVLFWDQYTDESPAKDLQATAEKMRVEIDQTVAAIKKGVEKK